MACIGIDYYLALLYYVDSNADLQHIVCYRCYYIGTPFIVQESIRKYWRKISAPSPAAHDSTVKKKDGKLLRNPQVRRKVNGKWDAIDYQRIQKRFYTQTDRTVYENWKIDHHQLLQSEVLPQIWK